MNKKIIIAVIVLNLWSVIFVEAVLDDGGDGCNVFHFLTK